MTSEGLGEMFEGDTADMCAGKFPLVSMGGRAEALEEICLPIHCTMEILSKLDNQHPRRLNSHFSVDIM